MWSHGKSERIKKYTQYTYHVGARSATAQLYNGYGHVTMGNNLGTLGIEGAKSVTLVHFLA